LERLDKNKTVSLNFKNSSADIIDIMWEPLAFTEVLQPDDNFKITVSCYSAEKLENIFFIEYDVQQISIFLEYQSHVYGTYDVQVEINNNVIYNYTL
jgi:hypothetical protein